MYFLIKRNINFISLFIFMFLLLYLNLKHSSILFFIILLFFTLRIGVLARLSVDFENKKYIYSYEYKKKYSNYNKKWINYVLSLNIDINFINLLSITKWKEKHFIEDPIVLYEINTFYNET